MATSLLLTKNVFHKIAKLENECHELLSQSFQKIKMPPQPERDISILKNHLLPSKLGLQTSEGQARLLHDLANIELQAMELGLRTLREYPNAESAFRQQLADISMDEGRHLRLCLEGIEQLGFQWGDWPVHSNLWDSTSSDDTLLERIFIVHCYLEGSGLDSGDAILKKLTGVVNPIARNIVKVIAEEEVGHVQFGLTWFRKLACQQNHLKSEDEKYFEYFLLRLKNKIPSRAAKISLEARKKAGFHDQEISALISSRS